LHRDRCVKTFNKFAIKTGEGSRLKTRRRKKALGLTAKIEIFRGLAKVAERFDL
jgi:hypothetical protein